MVRSSGVVAQSAGLLRPPAAPYEDAKRGIAQAIAAAAEEIIELSHRIHATPEVALEEHQASEWIAEALARHGYAVTRPAGSLSTAIRATLSGGRGSEGRRVGVMAEYDALPGLGHACGHNTMAASGVGAAIGLAAVAREVTGEIVFLGTPAEERFSGKQTMLDDGLFDGLDAALLYHPSDRNQMACNPLALEDVEVEFGGQAAHASGEPWLGRNALDAMTSLLVGIGLWRQQLNPGRQVHGIITRGGDAPNIIPAHSAGWFNIRSSVDEGLDEMEARFRDLVEGAALATSCTVNVNFYGRSLTMWNNGPLLARFASNAYAYDITEDEPRPTQGGSTDVGSVSKKLPTIHPHLAICEFGTPSHSVPFRDAAATSRADEVTLIAATTVAQTAYEVLVDNELAIACWRDFEHAKGS